MSAGATRKEADRARALVDEVDVRSCQKKMVKELPKIRRDIAAAAAEGKYSIFPKCNGWFECKCEALSSILKSEFEPQGYYVSGGCTSSDVGVLVSWRFGKY